jgi:hypothetical protein
LRYKHGQQAGRAKRTQIGLQTRAAVIGFFVKSKTRKMGRKGSHNGQRAGRENISSLSFIFFPYISNGNNNSNNSTNSIFELPAYNNAMDFFQFSDI